MIPSISEIVKSIADEPSKKQREIILYHHSQNKAFVNFLKLAYCPSIKWVLPEGVPPYTPNKLTNQHHVLYAEMPKMYLFIEGGHPTLNQNKREQLFVALLEKLEPADADLVLKAKDKKPLAKFMTENFIREVFPELLDEKITADA